MEAYRDDEGLWLPSERVRVDGSIKVSARCNSADTLIPGGKGFYTRKNSCSALWRVARVHQKVMEATGVGGYFVTATWPAGWKADERHAAFRKLLDNLRKMLYSEGYLWVRERHSSGEHHYHVIVRTRYRWNYRRTVVALSNRYCGSPNGLDVERIRSGRACFYAAKVCGYVQKTDVEERCIRSGNRWWGTSKVLRWTDPQDVCVEPDRKGSTLIDRGVVKVSWRDAENRRFVVRSIEGGAFYERQIVQKQVAYERARWLSFVANR